MFRATKEFKRDMAHRLPTHWWKCFNVHWHTYRALITIKSETLQQEWTETWMIKDFWNFKPIKDWIDAFWDHSYVWVKGDEVLEYLWWQLWYRSFELEENPTAEYMAKFLFEKSRELLPEVEIEKVVVYETPTSFAEYSLND